MSLLPTVAILLPLILLTRLQDESKSDKPKTEDKTTRNNFLAILSP
jgi:hypothetical protein